MDGLEIAPHRERPIAAGLVRRLYAQEGWWPERGEEAIARVLDALPAVGAWDGEELVAFARVVSDGVFRAYVEDAVVDPRYRGRGVGAALMERLLQEVEGVDLVSLFCKQRLAPFYEAQGFAPTKQVVLHRKGRQ